jgi:ABC-2 type transport system ATP-binding protein
VAQLSKGQGTRIRLVLAMAFRPRVLVLDEPATGLDLAGRRSLLRSVLDVVRDPQRTVIVSSHQLQDVERIADRLLVLDAGQVIQQGPTADLVGDDRTLEEAMVSWGAAG